MLHIALCGDKPDQRALTGGLLLRDIEQRPGLAARLSVFSSGDEPLERTEHAGGFDLYALDVIVPELSGIDVGVRLREKGSDAPIICLTTSADFAVDSYLAQAFYYLFKLVEPDRRCAGFDRAAAER